jgi:hypothetical protein
MAVFLWKRLHLVAGVLAVFQALLVKAVNFRIRRGKLRSRGAPPLDVSGGHHAIDELATSYRSAIPPSALRSPGSPRLDA